jgi:hypothetical protein
MTKILQDADSQRYKKQLADFMAMINPKPTPEEIDRLMEKYLSSRGENRDNSSH